MKKIVAAIIVIGVIAGGVLWQKHRARARALTTGEVYVRDQPSAPPRPLDSSRPAANDQIAPTTAPQAIAAPAPAQPANASTQPPAPPNADSIPRNPPSGLAFAGSGKFQLYRQGDITWRLDTQSGSACILFATDAQWRRPRVYQAGCGSRGETTVATGD